MSSREYEGLDPTELESLRAPPRLHQYAGLAGLAGQSPENHAASSRSPSEGFDHDGYLHIIAEPDYGDQTEVCCKHKEFPWTLVLISCNIGLNLCVIWR